MAVKKKPTPEFDPVAQQAQLEALAAALKQSSDTGQAVAIAPRHLLRAADRPSAPAPEPTTTRELGARALSEAQALLEQVHRLRADADEVEDPNRRARLLSNCANQLTQLGKLLGLSAEIDERKIIRTPAWRRLRDRLLEALRPYPDALRAIVEVLNEVEE